MKQAVALDKIIPPALLTVGPKLGAEIKARRQALGFTQEQAAKETKGDITTLTIARLESGSGHTPDVATLSALARALRLVFQIDGRQR